MTPHVVDDAPLFYEKYTNAGLYSVLLTSLSPPSFGGSGDGYSTYQLERVRDKKYSLLRFKETTLGKPVAIW